MTYDEDGEPEQAPPQTLNLPDLQGECVVLGVRVKRRENSAMSSRGYLMPCLEMVLRTTEGELKFFLTRDQASAFANGIVECLCDS